MEWTDNVLQCGWVSVYYAKGEKLESRLHDTVSRKGTSLETVKSVVVGWGVWVWVGIDGHEGDLWR